MSVSLRVLQYATIGTLALTVFVVAGCGGGGAGTAGPPTHASSESAKPGGVLHIGQLSEPATLNPSAMTETAAVEVSTQINEPLFKQDESGKIVPLLATGYERSADGLTWTFDIRHGVQFSTGKPMTATDVAFSLEAGRKSALWAGLWEDVKDIKVVSPYSVEVTTKKPMAAMLPTLTSYSVAVVPANYGGESEKAFAQHPIGTGPFMLKSWQHGTAITLVKNPHYRDTEVPLVNEVVYEDVPDDNSRVSQFKSGSLDIIGQPAASQLTTLEQVPGASLNEYDMFLVQYLGLNENHSVFKNPKIREAVNLAVDREGIVKTADSAHGEPAASFLPPAVPYHDANLKAPAQNLTKAKELVAEAEREGTKPTFKITTIAGQAYAELAGQILQQNLTEAGMSVTLQPLDISAVIEGSEDGSFDALLGEYYAGVPDPSELTSVYINLIAKPNGADPKSLAALDALAAEASAELDPGKREALYAQIQEKAYSELALIALSYAPALWALQEGVVGLEVNSVNSPWLNETGFAG